MSLNERIRLDAMHRVRRRELKMPAAAQLMRVSLRQAWRLWKRFKAQKDRGLMHRLRGRPSNRRLAAEVALRAVKLHQERYADFGPTLACEKLASDHGVRLSPNTLVRLLKERGLWQRRRRRGRHRRRRERRASFGSMLQMDGSHHDWFEGRGPKCVLMVIVDDATGKTYARFYAAETSEAAFDVLGRWIDGQGVPRSLYVDKHAIYRDEDHPEKPTQFGRAMQELGVELIKAHSPQAKGRVERRNGLFQDRLVKELRLRNISDMRQANALLEGGFLEDLNRRFAIKAADDLDLHRPLDKGLALGEILCVQEKRSVGQDWCVRWRNRWLQIAGEHEGLRLPRRQVTVKQLGGGRLLLEYQGRRLSFSECGSKPQAKPKPRPVINNRRWKPAADHPWKKELRAIDRPQPVPAAATPARALAAGIRTKAG